MKLDVTVLSGVSAGDVFHFDVDPTKPLTIGRAQENDLVLQDSSVSRKHAEIRLDPHALKLLDVGSTHGTLHMGFRLASGSDGARELQSGDEFKIGEAIFRISFDNSALLKEKTPPKKNAVDPSINGTINNKSLVRYLPKKKRDRFVLLAIVVGALALLFSLGDSGSLMPKQKSEVPLTIPQDRIIGFYKKGKEGDYSHLDKAQFTLPASDLVIEFDYRSQAPITVSIDEQLLETLKASSGGWQHVAIIVRDPHIGRERKLILDNTGYPAKQAKKIWAVNAIRATPLTLEEGTTFNGVLEETVSLAERLDKTTDSLCTLIRSGRKAVLAAIVERNLDAVVMPLTLDSTLPASDEIAQELRSMISERSEGAVGPTDEMGNRHLSVLSSIVSRLDVELWRRVKSRWNLAQLAADAKNYIEAHDQLKAAMTMFPDDVDYRRVLTDRMFDDKKIVPKKVRNKPEKYRKAARSFN